MSRPSFRRRPRFLTLAGLLLVLGPPGAVPGAAVPSLVSARIVRPRVLEPRALGWGWGAYAPAVLSDGGRTFAFEPADGRLRLLDAVTLRHRDVSVTPNCPIAAMGHGVVLMACTGTLIGLRTGRARAVPGAASGDELYALGAQWVQGTTVTADGAAADVLINWHTGERHVIVGHRNLQELDGRGPYDLDAPRLRDAPRCSHQWVYAREGALALVDGVDGRLLLSRCGGRPGSGRTLDRCRSGPCGSVQLAGGVASWSSGGFVRALRVGTRGVRAWRFPAFASDDPADSVAVAQARGRLVIGVRLARGVTDGPRTRYYMTSL